MHIKTSAMIFHPWARCGIAFRARVCVTHVAVDTSDELRVICEDFRNYQRHLVQYFIGATRFLGQHDEIRKALFFFGLAVAASRIG